jgi:hypothetical protein
MKKAPVVVYLLVLVAVALGFRQNEHPKLTGPYLGQRPPGAADHQIRRFLWIR